MFILLLEDLRFVIGLFFSLISLILLLAGVISPSNPHSDFNLNWMAAGYIGVFSGVMLFLGISAYRKNLSSPSTKKEKPSFEIREFTEISAQ